MEEIFEPRPSTSSEDIQLSRDTATRPIAGVTTDSLQRSNWVKESDTGPRKLSIIPRTSQYERHPLLQERSASGLSQLEELTNMLQRQKSFDIADSLQECDEVGSKATKTVTKITSRNDVNPMVNNNASVVRKNSNAKKYENERLDKPSEGSSDIEYSKLRRLEPRGALCERHPLLEKSESGMSELEMYLIEKEQELLLTSPIKDEALKNNFRTINNQEGGAQARRKQLQPRQNQYEKHALLESRDEQGLSPLDHFLHEKERMFIERIVCEGAVIDQEEDSTGSKGKCSEKCVCKNATCVICKPNHSSSPQTNHTVKPQENMTNSCGTTVTEEDSTHKESLDNKKNLINHENKLHEVIDLCHNTDDVHNRSVDPHDITQNTVESEISPEQYDLVNGHSEGSLDDIMRSHPPLMKKESSRETMIEPKETNKRVHFERTLSEKEREMKATSIAMTLDSQGQPIIQNKTDNNLPSDNEAKKKRRKFWPWWGNSNRLCQRDQCSEEGSPDCGGRDKTTETVPLVEETNTQQKDKNENNKKVHKKPCVIL